MNILILPAALAALGAVAALWLLRRRVWSISVAAVAMVLVGLVILDAARALPIAGPPAPPFVLWAAGDAYAWASPTRNDAPRTYVWHVPDDMRRALKKGPLGVESSAKGSPGMIQNGGGDFEPGEYKWAPLEPEHSEKDQ